jgi:ferritin
VRCSIELTISYVYLALHSYADRDNVGLPGFAAWFKDESDGERDHAQLLLNFQVRLFTDGLFVGVPMSPICWGLICM